MGPFVSRTHRPSPGGARQGASVGTDTGRKLPSGSSREPAMAGHDPSACRGFTQLLESARAGDAYARGRLLQQFWAALLHDARRDLPVDLQAKGGASDLVQETML